MEYTHNNAEDILGFTTWDDKKKLDELLRIDCKMYTELGSDSTKKEIADVKSASKKIYKVIQKINNLTDEGAILSRGNKI